MQFCERKTYIRFGTGYYFDERGSTKFNIDGNFSKYVSAKAPEIFSIYLSKFET